jgi:hypothetical protein
MDNDVRWGRIGEAAMGFLSKFFPRWFAPSKNVDLALVLIEFVLALKMQAMMEKGLGDELLDAWNKDRSLDNFNPNDLGLSRYAIFYICNTIFEACLANGIDDGRDTLNIAIYVLEQALNIENEDAVTVAMVGLYWHLAMSGKKLPADLEECEPEEADHAIFEASRDTAQRFARMPKKVEPTHAESKFYAAYCVSVAPEKNDAPRAI